MREILFRGKCVDSNKWLYGGYHTAFEGMHQIIHNTQFNLSSLAQVKPETVGQYTGLKDKNGAKVFEGDLVKYFIHTYKVGFHNGTFGLFSIEHVGFTPFFDSINMSCEIIGNIHEGDK